MDGISLEVTPKDSVVARGLEEAERRLLEGVIAMSEVQPHETLSAEERRRRMAAYFQSSSLFDEAWEGQ